jgi:hypothetical protein
LPILLENRKIIGDLSRGLTLWTHLLGNPVSQATPPVGARPTSRRADDYWLLLNFKRLRRDSPCQDRFPGDSMAASDCRTEARTVRLA